jgi:tRNA pseudouridine55 synthase
MATGVLPLVTGKFTRLSQFYLRSDKEYEGEIRLGFATDTYDAEGTAVGEPQEVQVTVEQVRGAAARFVGPILQTPPPFSAKKVAGVPAYKLARKGKEVALEPVAVQVYELEITGVEGDRAGFRARVSSGTYLRAIAHELGHALGVGGHLASLRRTAVGEFRIEDAVSLERLEAAARADELETVQVHPRKLLPEMPAVTATPDAVTRIRNGMAVNLAEMSRARQVKVFAGQAELVCIAERVAGTLFQPRIVLV